MQVTWHIVLALFRPKLCPIQGSEQLFHLNIFLRCFFGGALLHHTLTTTLALLRMLDRREPQETAGRGTRLAKQANTTAVKQGTRRKNCSK